MSICESFSEHSLTRASYAQKDAENKEHVLYGKTMCIVSWDFSSHVDELVARYNVVADKEIPTIR
jgi:hypothetical protein